MDNGASSYRRFRDDGDESGLIEIIRDYKDGLILYHNIFHFQHLSWIGAVFFSLMFS